jgi:rRNA maturation protein Nop10
VAGAAGAERATQAYIRAATLVVEAHAWGFDMATWRAHLNALTWPEVLRQLAITAGWGPRRCRPAKQVRVYDDCALGEDVIEGEDGSLSFRWPSRFHANPAHGEYTMKEACWKVPSRFLLKGCLENCALVMYTMKEACWKVPSRFLQKGCLENGALVILPACYTPVRSPGGCLSGRGADVAVGTDDLSH